MNGNKFSNCSDIIFTLVNSDFQYRNIKILLKSLRSFGGVMAPTPVLVFTEQYLKFSILMEEFKAVDVIKLEGKKNDFYFYSKVNTSALAEKLTQKKCKSLIWLSSNCLILKPPVDFKLINQLSAAFRPVHIKNIGSATNQRMDKFWMEMYRVIRLDEADYSVNSLVDNFELRPYFNTHCYSIDPKLGILHKWNLIFNQLITDKKFIKNICNDELHQIFLHQALLSALLTKYVPRTKLKILDIDYSYPLHFQDKLENQNLFSKLSEITCPVYEGQFNYPGSLSGIKVSPTLNEWFLDIVN